jgi:hypothetical protein
VAVVYDEVVDISGKFHLSAVLRYVTQAAVSRQNFSDFPTPVKTVLCLFPFRGMS